MDLDVFGLFFPQNSDNHQEKNPSFWIFLFPILDVTFTVLKQPNLVYER